jgi:hypothetical protein
MTKLLALAICLAATGCSPKLSVGYDTTAKVTGPLANLQTISRVEAVTGTDTSPPPEGRNYSLGLAFGDKNFTIGTRVGANNISGSTLSVDGPQYMSASGAIDFRYNLIRFKHVALGMELAPTRTLLVDSTDGTRSWGSGIRYGGGASVMLGPLSVYADAYQEKMMFIEGPADGTSTRTGVTLGVAFQP